MKYTYNFCSRTITISRNGSGGKLDVHDNLCRKDCSSEASVLLGNSSSSSKSSPLEAATKVYASEELASRGRAPGDLSWYSISKTSLDRELRSFETPPL